MMLPFAPEFERFLEKIGYLEVERLGETNFLQEDGRAKWIRYSVRLDGKDIGTYNIFIRGDDIRFQQYIGRVPGYLNSDINLSYGISVAGSLEGAVWRLSNPDTKRREDEHRTIPFP